MEKYGKCLDNSSKTIFSSFPEYLRQNVLGLFVFRLKSCDWIIDCVRFIAQGVFYSYTEVPHCERNICHLKIR